MSEFQSTIIFCVPISIKAKAEKKAGLEMAAMNEVLLTDAYLREKEIEATSKLNKVFYGENLKHVFNLHRQD
jgi:hypothetical protein